LNISLKRGAVSKYVIPEERKQQEDQDDDDEEDII
jgi:hypothetical protein